LVPSFHRGSIELPLMGWGLRSDGPLWGLIA
jgi:hypothetical protein